MNLKQQLHARSFDILALVINFNKQKLIRGLTQIIKEDYEELHSNNLYLKNFLELVSAFYASEQIAKQKAEKTVQSKSSLFDNEFMQRLDTLKQSYDYKPSISQ